MAGANVTLRRSTDGHFFADVRVDGHVVRFLVDTGASEVTLAQADAERLGFDVSSLRYSKHFRTANGVVRGAPVRLGELRIGPIVMHDVRASVNEAEMSSSLLGMSFLDRLSGYEVTQDRLILRP